MKVISVLEETSFGNKNVLVYGNINEFLDMLEEVYMGENKENDFLDLFGDKTDKEILEVLENKGEPLILLVGPYFYKITLVEVGGGI